MSSCSVNGCTDDSKMKGQVYLACARLCICTRNDFVRFHRNFAEIDISSLTTMPFAPEIASTSNLTTSRPANTLTRTQLAHRIAHGETLVLHRRKIYKLDRWLPKHPGGELAILHFVGRDATDEIEAYHSQDTMDRLMSRFVIAHLAPEDWDQYRPLVPPVQLGYRKGKLDHPHAQLAMWAHHAKISSSDRDVKDGLLNSASLVVDRPDAFPLPVALLEPPLDPAGIEPAREKHISAAYQRMHEQVKAAKLYDLRPAGYARELARYILLAAIAYAFWSRGQTQIMQLEDRRVFCLTPSTLSFLLSSFFMGCFWHQLTFTAHDSGHSGITHSWPVDRLIGTIIANFIGGLSIGWWCDNHDVHHLVTNHPEHDPDIQHMPFFAISPEFVLAGQTTAFKASASGDASSQSSDGEKPLGLWSSYYRRVLVFDAPSRFLLRHQHKLYYIIMSLGRFNLYANSYGFLATKARKTRWWSLEIVGVLFFWTWYGCLLASLPSWPVRIAYLMISHIVTSPLHVQIVLSHFAQSSEDLGLNESFASRQIRTTMDVACPPWLDFLHGGLHMQVSHHLFPRVPRHNLRELRDRFVIPFSQKHGLRYHEYGFAEGNGRVLSTLKKVADQVHILARVAQAQAKADL